jgi:hypothetical protein
LGDPNSTSDIESDATRYRTELFFSEVLPDRLMEYEPRLYVNAFTVNEQGSDVIKTLGRSDRRTTDQVEGNG